MTAPAPYCPACKHHRHEPGRCSAQPGGGVVCCSCEGAAPPRCSTCDPYGNRNDGHLHGCPDAPAPPPRCNHDFTEREIAVADGQCSLCAHAEIARLRGMIGYASHAPTLGSAITILNDALNGVTGADNVHEVRSEITRLRGALKKIRDNPEFETEVGIEDIARAALEGREE